MDVRLQFEWSNDKAKDLVKAIDEKGFLGPGNTDIVGRDDSSYEVSLTVRLKPKRKPRKKAETPDEKIT